MLLNCLQWYSIEYRTDNQWFRIGLIYPMRLIHLYLTWPKTKALPKMWLLLIQKNEAIIYKTYNINSLSYILLPLMVRKYAPFRCFISLFKAVLPTMHYYILYRTSILDCCFRQKEVWSSCPHPVRFITVLVRISFIFSSPFFRFMGFFCFCSRQGIAIPYCCHAAFFRCMSQCSSTTVYVMSPLVTVVWL